MAQSGLSCGHGTLLTSSIIDASEEAVKPYKCGECHEKFSAICILHSHIKEGSYRYDAETKTAFPVNGCFSTSLKGEEHTESDPTESSEKYYRVYSLHKKRKSADSSQVLSIIKIVDDPSLKTDGLELHSDVDSRFVDEKAMTNREEKSTHFYSGIKQPNENDSQFIKEKALSSEHAEQPEHYSESDTMEINTEHIGKQANTQTHPSEIIISALGETSGRDNSQQREDSGEPVCAVKSQVLVVETVPEIKMEDYGSCNIKLPALYNALVSTDLHSHIQMGSSEVCVNEALKEPLDSSKIDPDVHSKIKEINENADIQTTVIDNISEATNEDKDLEQTVAAFDKLGESHLHNRQVVVTLYGMETDEDGSVQIVVGENDAAIFNSPVGDEILKALKGQAKDIPPNGSTQVVFNYSESQLGDTNQEPHMLTYNSLEGHTHGMCIDGSVDSASFRPPKRQRKIDNDDSMPKFKIHLPVDNAATGSVSKEASGNKKGDGEPNAGRLKPVVFKIVNEKLSMADALNILTECNLGMHSDLISKTQPVLAKGGELYVVDLEALPHRKDCRYDKYLWVNCVARKFPRKDPVLHKHVFKIRLPNSQFSDAFQRHIYQFIEEAKYCIIHYIGHESVFQPLAHGNSKCGAVFNRTCPSVLTELKELSKEEGVTANKLYKQIESLQVPDDVKGFRTPRNLSQIKNTFRYARKTKVQDEQRQ